MACSGLGPEGLRSGASGARAGPEGSALAADSLATRGWLRCRLLGLPSPKARAPRGSGAFTLLPGCLCRFGRRPEGRWRFGCRWLQVPIESVAAVRGARRRPSPWFGARWVRRAVRGARRRPLPWSGPVDPSAAGREPGGSVAAVRGARRRPSPWFGARWVRRRSAGPGGSCCLGSGPEGPSPRFGAPEGVRPRGSGPGGSVAVARGLVSPSRGWGCPKASVTVIGARGSLCCGSWAAGSIAAVRGARRRPSPWLGARWVRHRGSGVRESLRRGSGSGWSLCSGSGLPGEPFSIALRPLDPSAAVRGSRRSLSRWLGGPWVPSPRVMGPVGPSRGSGRPKASVPVVGARWVRRRGSESRGSVTAGRGRGVRRAVRGARKRPSPWSGLRGSVAVARDPWIPSLGPGSGRSLA
jgi:hypothetical protein